MLHNVYQTHIGVKPFCVSGTISRFEPLSDNSHMAHKSVMIPRGKTFLREWREKAGLTLVEVSELIKQEGNGLTKSHGQLSRIERGESPYAQDLIEFLASVYGCSVSDLLFRHPTGVPSIDARLANATEEQRAQVFAVADVVLKFDTGKR